MNWMLAALLAGAAAYVADWVLWGKVFVRGMDPFVTPPPAGQPFPMASLMIQSAALALAYGLVFAFVYRRFMGSLWTPPGVLGAMELATVLWLPIAFAALGTNVWYDRTRRLLTAQTWAWLIRMNVAAIVVGLLIRPI